MMTKTIVLVITLASASAHAQTLDQICSRWLSNIASAKNTTDEVRGAALLEAMRACRGAAAPQYQAPPPDPAGSTTNCYFAAGTMTCFNN